MIIGFNYDYRRSANSQVAAAAVTPNSTTSALPNNNAPSASGTPAPQKTQVSVARSNGPSVAPTPPPQASHQQGPVPPSGKETPSKDKASTYESATSPTDAQRNAAKKWDVKKKDKKDGADEGASATPSESKHGGASVPASGKATPAPDDGWPISPTGATGATSPTPRKRNPWTIFMRYTGQRSEDELKEYFGDAKVGLPPRSIMTSRDETNRVSDLGEEDTLPTALREGVADCFRRV